MNPSTSLGSLTLLVLWASCGSTETPPSNGTPTERETDGTANGSRKDPTKPAHRDVLVLGESIGIERPRNVASALALEPRPEGPIVLRGRVSAVCRQDGCWFDLESGGARIRVNVEGVRFFVPFDLEGRNVDVRGRLENVEGEETPRFIATGLRELEKGDEIEDVTDER